MADTDKEQDAQQQSDDMSDSKKVQERIAERAKRAEELREMGIDPYPYSFEQTHSARQILDAFNDLEAGEKTDEKVAVAGRLMTIRNMGKIAFAHIQDQTGRIQVFFRQNDIGKDLFTLLKKIDIGDFLGVQGHVFATKTGETSVYVESFTVLTKSVRDLPEKYHGLKDPELRYRQRYLDLAMNQDVRDVFFKRSLMIRAIREFFAERGFVEVETPALQLVYGGANARPFTTHINAWKMDMFLSISPELYLKRLVVGGFEKVFTICKNFRNEGVDHSHNPEFTMLEAYQAYADYTDMMDLIEQCYEYAARTVNGDTTVEVVVRHEDGSKTTETVDFKAPWPRKTMAQLIQETLDIDILSMDEDALKAFAEEQRLALEGKSSWGELSLLIFDELVEPTVIQPTHVIDRPKEASPLCKAHREDERLIEQNEPLAAGMELGNMYSELNDPLRQRELLTQQAEQLRGGDDEAHPMDEDFVRAIEYGMPPTGGIGFGIDRMAMLLTGQTTIKDVILFPIVKPKE